MGTAAFWKPEYAFDERLSARVDGGRGWWVRPRWVRQDIINKESEGVGSFAKRAGAKPLCGELRDPGFAQRWMLGWVCRHWEGRPVVADRCPAYSDGPFGQLREMPRSPVAGEYYALHEFTAFYWLSRTRIVIDEALKYCDKWYPKDT